MKSENSQINEENISLVVTDGKIYRHSHSDITKFKDSKTPALIEIDDILFEMTNTITPGAKKSRKKSKKRSIRLKTLKNIKNRSSKKRSK